MSDNSNKKEFKEYVYSILSPVAFLLFVLGIVLLIAVYSPMEEENKSFIPGVCTVSDHEILKTTCDNPHLCYDAIVYVYAVYNYRTQILVGGFTDWDSAVRYLNDYYPIGSNYSCYYNSFNYRSITVSLPNTGIVLALGCINLVLASIAAISMLLIYTDALNKIRNLSHNFIKRRTYRNMSNEFNLDVDVDDI